MGVPTRVTGRLGLLAALVAGSLTAVPAAAQTEVHDGAPECGVVEGAGPVATDDGAVRVATFNILHTQGDYDDETLDARVELIADELAASGADAAGLQEVTASADHGLVAERVAAGLAARTGDDWSWCFFRSNPHLPGEPDTGPGGVGGPISQAIADQARAGDAAWSEGVAVVSRFAITASAAHRLVPRAVEAPICQVDNLDDPLAIPTCLLDTRQVLWARVATPCGALDLFGTHLANDESSASEASRQLQVVDALAEIDRRAARDTAPDVFVGDFNTLERGPVWQAVVDAGFVDTYRAAAPAAPGLTSGQDIEDPEPTVTRRIDYVFARPGTRPIEPTDPQVLGDEPAPFQGSGGQTVVWPSDHYGVAVTVLGAPACAQPAASSSSPPRSEPAASGHETATGVPPSTTLPASGEERDLRVPMAVSALALGGLGLRRRLRGPPSG